MVSTYIDRIKKAREYLLVLLGPEYDKYTYSRKRPNTLPKGNNYLPSEWIALNDIASAVRNNNPIAINDIFTLEEMETKYQPLLFLAKVEK